MASRSNLTPVAGFFIGNKSYALIHMAFVVALREPPRLTGKLYADSVIEHTLVRRL
jgi:hypothetical protein